MHSIFSVCELKYWIPFSHAERILNITNSGLFIRSGCDKIWGICCADFFKFCTFCWYFYGNSLYFLKASSQYIYIKLKTSLTQINLYGSGFCCLAETTPLHLAYHFSRILYMNRLIDNKFTFSVIVVYCGFIFHNETS